LVAPGIFREIFQMTSADPRVQVREDHGPQKPVEDRRAAPPPVSQAEKAKTKSKKPPKAEAQAVDGWSSTTTNQ
jgi:hypothetical protein